ncbi:hypothetical protein ACP70R_018350 [Stipagrostis hirtigluma subsp. patula]
MICRGIRHRLCSWGTRHRWCDNAHQLFALVSFGIPQVLVPAFALIWVLGCFALPYALFGKRRCEISFANHSARIGLMCFTVLVLYGLYRMCLQPTADKDHYVAPTPTSYSGEYLFMSLLAFVLVANCYINTQIVTNSSLIVTRNPKPDLGFCSYLSPSALSRKHKCGMAFGYHLDPAMLVSYVLYGIYVVATKQGSSSCQTRTLDKKIRIVDEMVNPDLFWLRYILVRTCIIYVLVADISSLCEMRILKRTLQIVDRKEMYCNKLIVEKLTVVQQPEI